MKKYLSLLLIAAIALLGAVAPVLAYDEDDQTVGGASAPGASAHGKTLVFSGTYDFSENTYDTNDVVKLVNVPAGILIEKIVVSTEDVNQILTNTLYKYTTEWAAAGDAQAYAASTDASVVYFMSLPAITASNPQATNTVVDVVVADQAAGSIAATSWGFINTLSTNGAPTAGKLTISVIGCDVLPSVRED